MQLSQLKITTLLEACAVCETLGSHCPVPVERVGVKDRFGEVGPIDYLKQVMGLTAQDIAVAAKKSISRK